LGDDGSAPAEARPRVCRVLPDVPAIDKTFDYLVPDAVGDQVRVGTVVRIVLHGRRVGGWVVADDVDPPPGVTLLPLAKVVGWGPPPELLDLAEWAAWRWCGRTATFLVSASADHAVPGLPRASRGGGPPATVASPVGAEHEALIASALGRERSVLRLPPGADRYPVVLAAARLGNALILTPSAAGARHLGLRLRRAGVDVAILPKEWAAARVGSVCVGSRAAAWAPVPDLAAVVVLDEHDEVYQREGSPTWHARTVVIERARRAGVPCVLVSPTPSLEALQWAGDDGLLVPSRSVEREGWPIIDLVDRRREEPGRGGLYSERFVKAMREAPGTVVCVLNRKGRSRLLACARCGEATRCEHCSSSMAQADDGTLVCRSCGTARPTVCQACGATTLKNLRVGVTRAREELEALVREPVVEVTGETADDQLAEARVYVGTEAVLHQVPKAALVAFLDFDQELLAPRYRAAEEAMALVVRAARLVGGGRRDGGRVLVQTRLPQHEVLQAALLAEPGRAADAEWERRRFLQFPPVTAMAAVGSVAAPAFVEALGHPVGVEVLGPSDGQWLVRAPDHQLLCDALASVTRPPGRLRLEVDPLRI
jgi:primosomal protein N' (replication factor Y)